ncbi:MAG: phosphotransferase [Actinophytocola sp.]|uniref:aminoglycoside phosphotransferase family protein n=1 Tax=Actinophytocola sp. TaxID=1872138 RepID=UPI0013282B65|nr:aminoglycoside phosphotransferase family protein [Actinophytocola sp.]MPZ83272.1 phosphotransferase [Actinophytocola sp.]
METDAEIDAELVRRLVAAQFPRWAGLPVRPVAKPGWDNATYRLGEEMSVRLPRFERWVGQVERERRWLPRLAPHLPLAVPVPLAVGAPDEGYPYPWSVYRWLPGEPSSLDLVDDPRRAAADLAEFLAALQRVDATGGPPPEWSNGFRGADLADERDSPVVASRMYDRITALEGIVDTDAVWAVWETALAAPVRDGPPVWVHGDPAPPNMLVDGGRLSAVIDFGTLAVGDPACDLIAAWAFLTADTRDTFRAALGVDDATWARGRGWGLSAVLPSPEQAADPAARRRLDELTADHRLTHPRSG